MKTRAAALAFVMIGTSLPAHADALCPLVAELNHILVASTGYTPVPCPEIGFSVLGDKAGLRSQAGAYFTETGRIELAPDLDLTTAYGQSFLLHEMVHAAHFAAGEDQRAPCPAALEAEAYRVQVQFLQVSGLTRDALLTRMLGDQLGTCGADPGY
jgi:hypothetical protein